MLTDAGAVDLAVPRDRNRTFEPQIVRKGQTRLEGFNKRIIALYTRGMTTGDIRARAAKHETRQHTLGGMSGVGKPAQAFQIAQICAHHYWIGIRLMSAHNGGSRAAAATSDCHAARLAFQSVSDPNTGASRKCTRALSTSADHGYL